MLKLRDDIDFKKLEKYKFKEGDKTWDYWDGVRKIIVYKKDRRVSINSPSLEVYDKLFDLIKDEVLEKVEWTYFKGVVTTKIELTKQNRELQERNKELERQLVSLLNTRNY